MPAATPDPRAFGAGLAALKDDLGTLAKDLRFDVVHVRPLHNDAERSLSRAEVDVLVSPGENTGDDLVIDALLGLQALGHHHLSASPDSPSWAAIGRPLRAAFVVTLPAEAALDRTPVPIVQHPLEAQPMDRHHHTRPDAQRP